MRFTSVLLLLVASGCARYGMIPGGASTARQALAEPAPAPPAPPAAVAAAPVQPAVAAVEAPPPATDPAAVAEAAAAAEAQADDDTAAADDADGEDESGGVSEEGESHDAVGQGDGSLHYSVDLSDEELARRWEETPESLGSISIGFVDEGRIVNAEQFPKGDAWVVVSPEKTWATHETIEYVIAAIRKVKEELPDAPPLRVNQISGKEGGYLRPHKSHQTGRDVDLGFYYPTAETIWARERERYIDVARNWALLKALVTLTDVQLILVDKRVQKVIYDYALKSGEDQAWLDSLFNAGRASLIQHARRHRDHFHVRFYNPRAQELGRRVAPMLAQRPEHNLALHRVKKGDTLGAIARKYGSTVAALQKANHLKGSFLRLAQVLKVPLRGPCTQCPIPPAIVVPGRRLPPQLNVQRDAEMPRDASAQGGAGAAQ